MKFINLNGILHFFECLIEKCMEWIVYLSYCFGERKEWKSNLSECYCIYKEFIGKEFIKDFLDERERILNKNRYKMQIRILCERGDDDTVGKVILYRKKRAIHQATLKVRNNSDNSGIIYWSFDNKNNIEQK